MHQRSTSASSSSGATTALTRPIASASCAEYWRVRKSTSRAFFSPTTAGISWQPHQSGAEPILGPAWPKRPVVSVIVRSEIMLSSLPPPMQYPRTRQMMGLPLLRIALARRGPMMWPRRFSAIVRVGSRTSPPTQKARSPAPVKTITPTASSSAAASNASHSSTIVWPRKALSRSGRLMVIVARPASTS